MSSRKAVLLEDSNDWYNRRLSRIFLVLTAAWAIYAFGLSSTVSEIDGQTGQHVSYSRDAGLKMTLAKGEMPALLLRTHSIAGALLIFSIMLQKALVVRMASETLSAKWHRWNGYACLVLMLFMAGPGYLMGGLGYSAWRDFNLFSIAFAAPYVFYIVAISTTAYFKQFRWHRLFANQALKACIVVPLARLVGGVVQRSWPEIGEAEGYYLGIGLVTIAFGIWEICDIYAFILQPCGVTAMDRRARAKMK